MYLRLSYHRFMLFVREHSELRYRMENKNLGYDSRKYIDS